ncbi:MAG: hypothetical protein HY514_03070 [Candidatus Aenigmarchaeota archaeon]|nr:hypothetical protein [Candidatus Aenigmarchaeota archaeon]
MKELEKELYEDRPASNKRKESWKKMKKYLKGCVDPANARLYGTFQERAALNITQFPKIQGSLLIRMGLVYPLMSYLVKEMGVPQDAAYNFHGVAINYHTWLAGYLAYLAEIQLGMSKYPMELISKSAGSMKNYFAQRCEKSENPQAISKK